MWQWLPHCYCHINHSDDPQRCISTTCNPQTGVSNPIHMSQPFRNPFRPPTTPRHVFQTPDTRLNPSATCFDHLQPSRPLIQPSDMCFEPQTCVSTPQQPVSMPLTCSCTPGPKMHVQLYMCFFIYIYCSYIAVITSYNTYLKTS